MIKKQMQSPRPDGTFGYRYFDPITGELLQKDCPQCRNTLPIDSFSTPSSSYCTQCAQTYQKTTKKPRNTAKKNSSRTDKEIQATQSAIHPDKTKHCPSCNTSRPLSAFHKNRENLDGLAYRCKSCAKRARKTTK